MLILYKRECVMAVTIKLKNSVFDPGGPFYGVPTSKAVLSIESGKHESFAGKIVDVALDRGGQFALMIDWSGVSTTDNALESYMKNEIHYAAFGAELLYMVEVGLVDVIFNGATLTLAQVKAFTAP